MSDPIYCPRCEIILGDGRDKCRRAVNSDLCMDCAIEMDPPREPEDDLRGGPIEESPSYREALRDAGRGW